MSLIIIVIILLFLFGGLGFPGGPVNHGYGWGPSGILWTIAIIVLILWALGRL
jgi:hypothetical protein